MPFYTIHHTSLFNGFEKSQIATRLTDAHGQITGTPRTDVKVAFIDVREGDFFSGGEPCDEWVRVVVQLNSNSSPNLSREQKRALRSQMTSACRALLYASCEVQTEVLEGIRSEAEGVEESIDENTELNGYQTDYHHNHFPVDDYGFVIGGHDIQHTDLLLPEYERGANKKQGPAVQAEFDTNNFIDWSGLNYSSLSSALYSSTHGLSDQHANKKLTSGFQDIDGMLDGGLNYGEGGVACLSIADNCSGRDIALAFLVHHIISSPSARATVIDTAFRLDVRTLNAKIMRELLLTSTTDVDIGATAMKMLEKISIIKVFDFVGLIEAVGELRCELEYLESSSKEPLIPAQMPPRGTIADSQDDGEDILDNDSSKKDMESTITALHQRTTKLPQDFAHTKSCRPHLLLVDDISTIALPLVNANAAEGQTLLTSFMRHLAHITAAHNMCSILINSATLSSQGPQYGKETTPSIFSSCLLRPALGVAFQWTVDLHLMVHSTPQTASDAKVVFDPSTSLARRQQAQMVNVIEVLYDRLGSRFQQWAAFKVDGMGCLQKAT